MGKSSKITTGYHYKPAFHVGICRGPFDAYLEWRIADKTAFAGELTASGEIVIDQPKLFGGEKDQGGVEGTLEIMFGEATQMPNAYLAEVFGPQQPAWRGLATMVWKGGRFGGNNPYPHKHASKIRKIKQGWDGDWGSDPCWYPEKAEVTERVTFVASRWQHVELSCDEQTVRIFLDGKLSDTAELDFVPNGGSGGQSTIGRYSALASDGGVIDAYLRNVRVTKRVRHTSDFVPTKDIPSAATDPMWADVLMALPMTDSVTADDKGNTWTLYGDDAEISSQAGPDGLPSAYFHGGNVRTPYVPGLNLGNKFTIDYWIKPVAMTGTPVCINQFNSIHAGYSLSIQPGGLPAATFGRNTWPAEPVYLEAVSQVGLIGMNPAHMLVYSRTDGERGREPFANINEASLLAAADRLHAESFALCTDYNPASESPAEFERRICRVIDGSFERSLTDGEWYLDLARDDYDSETLPVLTDDDILEFQELPTTLDRAVNSLSVRYFDVERKEQVATPAVRALGLIRTFGEIHETLEFPEIATAELAMRVAQRELLKRITPAKAFKLVTTPVTYAWRGNQYFRLQSVKRRIADMVCIVGERERGTLTSGAIRLNATQDIYGLPEATYIEVEHGEDVGALPPDVISTQRADEAPYVDLAARLPRAELEALPAEIGYAMAVAAQPNAGWDFTMWVAPDAGAYEEAGNGTWCPTATTAGIASRSATVVPLATHQGLADVPLGSAAFWDDEIVRVDDKDVGTGTVTLGRGCADTVPAAHAAGSRLFFSDDHAAYDVTEYADGEEVDVKLLANRGAQQLDLALATAMPITFDQRAFRPYPPADFQVNGEASPGYLFGELTASWAHRDRLLQADLLVDTTAADIGPEAGTTYTVRWYVDDVLEHTDTGETGTSVAYTPSGDGNVRVEAESLRDGATSWQAQVRTFAYTAVEAEPLQIFSSNVTIFGDPIYME